MGDELVSLPEAPTDISPQEKEAINSLFGESKISGVSSGVSSMNWKLIGGSLALFALLANPWIDSMICKIPKCENPMIIFGIKMILFTLVMVVLSYFL